MGVKQMADDSLVEKLVAAEEPRPMMEVPLATEKPAMEHPALRRECLEDSQEDDQVEVHAPDDDPNDW